VGDRALSYQLSIPGSGLNSYRLNDSETCESLRKVFITAGGTGVCSGNALGRGLLVFLVKVSLIRRSLPSSSGLVGSVLMLFVLHTCEKNMPAPCSINNLFSGQLEETLWARVLWLLCIKSFIHSAQYQSTDSEQGHMASQPHPLCLPSLLAPSIHEN
jgi:hypothetical protein